MATVPDFRRGADEVAKAKSRAMSGGGFTPFAPEIYWGKDAAKRYLLFLNPMSKIPTVDMINMIPVKKKVGDDTKEFFERVIARTDPSVGENTDPMNKDWDYRIQDYCVAVAVELEPTVEEVRGRMRPTGFAIKTSTYNRRLRDKEGELLDESEEVTTPVIGFVHQSPHNFFNMVTAYDSENAEIERTPLKITQVGEKTDTAFDVTGYPELSVDLEPLLEYIDGFSYFTEDERTKLVAQVDAEESDEDAALLIGSALLDKRLLELHDQERYDRIYGGITQNAKYGASKKGKGGAKKAAEKPARRSSRRSRNEDAEPEGGASDNAETAEPEATPEPEAEAPKARRRTRGSEKPKQQDPAAMSNLDRLRKQQAEIAEAATA